uniref:Uncharacterized protein n=1 Tax=Phytophthora ramorum TaxID=164328 RepID=H3H2H2_PHYRM
MKTAHSRLQEEHAELHHERSDMEGEAWFWMVEKKGVQDEYKKLQDEHAQWKAACAALVKEVEHKVLEEEYMARLHIMWTHHCGPHLGAEQLRRADGAPPSATPKNWALTLTLTLTLSQPGVQATLETLQ